MIKVLKSGAQFQFWILNRLHIKLDLYQLKLILKMLSYLLKQDGMQQSCFICCISVWAIVPGKFPFTNSKHRMAAFVCLKESITFNAAQTTHWRLGIVANEKSYPSWASAWFTLEVLSICKRNISSDYNVTGQEIDISSCTWCTSL